MRVAPRFPGHADCVQLKSRSNRVGTNRCTIHAHSGTCRRVRTHWALSVEPVPVRSSTGARSWAMTAAGHHPGKKCVLNSAAGSPLPFSLAGKAVFAAAHSAEPFAIADRFEPGNRHHRLLGTIEIRITRERRGRSASRAHKASVLGVSHLTCSQVESIDPNPVHRAFIFLTRH